MGRARVLRWSQWPARVQCYGHDYVALDQRELDHLLGLLIERKLALANRYRVGGSWPRGHRRQKALVQQPLREGYDAICAQCGCSYTYANARAVGTDMWQRFCAPSCELGATADAVREVVE